MIYTNVTKNKDKKAQNTEVSSGSNIYTYIYIHIYICIYKCMYAETQTVLIHLQRLWKPNRDIQEKFYIVIF